MLALKTKIMREIGRTGRGRGGRGGEGRRGGDGESRGTQKLFAGRLNRLFIVWDVQAASSLNVPLPLQRRTAKSLLSFAERFRCAISKFC